MGTACGGGGSGSDPAATTGGSGSGGSTGTGATTGTGGGAQACIPANPNGPADHPAAGYDTQPCTACHATAYTGGFVYDAAGGPVAQATLTLTPTGAGPLTAVTGSTGMFYYSGLVPAPYEVCISRCPDTVCSAVGQHPNAGDCGTCHGVTTPRIHLP
jgi:hypothetical protein